jgi:hypothetical protein
VTAYFARRRGRFRGAAVVLVGAQLEYEAANVSDIDSPPDRYRHR